jgi:LysM repeat protein
MFSRTVLLVLLLVCVWGFLANNSGASGHGHSYLVKPGDTLWSISSRYYGGDSRKGVWDLERRNNLDDNGTITPGERLLLPW